MPARMLWLVGFVIVLVGCRPPSESSREPAAQPPRGAIAMAIPNADAHATVDPIPSETGPTETGPLETGPLSEIVSVRTASALDEKQGEAKRSHERLFVDWPKPRFVVALSGRQNGYIEPCGCTGLTNQKGGLARRQTFLRQLSDRGWPTVRLDVGNQVRRYGRQAEIKFQISVEGLKKMGYFASTFGPDDLRLTIDELAATTAQAGENETAFVSANVAILDREFTPRFRVAKVADQRVGVVGVLGDQARVSVRADEILTERAIEGVRTAWRGMSEAGCDYSVLLVQGTRDESVAIAQAVPHFDIVATSGGGDEPTLVPERIPGTKSLLVQVGNKGMYLGVIGVFDDRQTPWRYQRVPLDSRFEDSREMLDLLATYQQQLEQQGLEGLGVRPLPHPSGRQYVGSEACGECHTQAMTVWRESSHARATDSLVKPAERSDIARHFDPECLSCHVTGWNVPRFTPYETGYLSLAGTPTMLGSGCENCHGPGSKHVAIESGNSDGDAAEVARLRAEMRLILADAEKKCMECHDLDNSPDFHVEGAFEAYWKRVAHPGKD